MRLLFTIAARAQTTACQLFRASLADPQTRMRNLSISSSSGFDRIRAFRRTIKATYGYLESQHEKKNTSREDQQSSHYRQRLPQHSYQAANDLPPKRPLSQSMPASPPHAGSCDKQRIFPPRSCPAGKRALRLSQTPLIDFLESSSLILR